MLAVYRERVNKADDVFQRINMLLDCILRGCFCTWIGDKEVMVDYCPHSRVIVGLGVLIGPCTEMYGDDGKGRGGWGSCSWLL